MDDCGDDGAWLKYKANGELADDVKGGHRVIEALVRRQDNGSWKVVKFVVKGVGTCG